ncbi:unnamed protein product, partial [Didymodactylos carnosus]
QQQPNKLSTPYTPINTKQAKPNSHTHTLKEKQSELPDYNPNRRKAIRPELNKHQQTIMTDTTSTVTNLTILKTGDATAQTDSVNNPEYSTQLQPPVDKQAATVAKQGQSQKPPLPKPMIAKEDDNTRQIDQKDGDDEEDGASSSSNESSTKETISNSNKNRNNKTQQDNDFDNFIMQTFEPFNGTQNANEWLSITENKFKQYQLSRSLRFEAIPLLVENQAKRWYINQRRQISSFDDFYELLLQHYNDFFSSSAITSYNQTERANTQNKSIQEDHHTRHRPTLPDNHQIHQTMFSNTQFLPSHRSTAYFDAANGEIPVITSTMTMASYQYYLQKELPLASITSSAITPIALLSSTSTTNNTTNSLDQTTIDLRKAIMENMIKNPKTFTGGKEDVRKWLEELENQFESADIPDTNRFSIISCHLKAEAKQWFNDNKIKITSWKSFVDEIKKAFTSSYQAELSFNKLESYNQGQNQTIRNYYTEMHKISF